MQQISWEVMKIYPLKIYEIRYGEFLYISYDTRKLSVLRKTGPETTPTHTLLSAGLLGGGGLRFYGRVLGVGHLHLILMTFLQKLILLQLFDFLQKQPHQAMAWNIVLLGYLKMTNVAFEKIGGSSYI